jgi:hypothetical protein
MKQLAMKKVRLAKMNMATTLRPQSPAGVKDKAPASGNMSEEITKLKEAAAAVQQIRLSARRELEMARQMRAEAAKYQQETETRARSQAQQLILHTRLSTQKEIEDLIHNASTEIQKVLADIRVIRITAQEELAAQRSFTNAARICSLSLNVQKETREPAEKKKKQLAAKK